MEIDENTPEMVKKLIKTKKYQAKPLPKLFKYLGKIKEVHQYDDYVKHVFAIPAIEWFIEWIIRAALIFLCLALLGITTFSRSPRDFVIALGLSQAWFMIVSLKRDLWRKEEHE